MKETDSKLIEPASYMFYSRTTVQEPRHIQRYIS